MNTSASQLDPRRYLRPVVLIIDMQNEYCHKDGWLQKGLGIDVGRGIAVIPKVVRLAEFARKEGLPLIFTRMTVRDDLVDAGLFPEMRPVYQKAGLREGTWGVDIVDELRPRPEDVVIDKHRFNAFLGTSLEQILWGYKADSIIAAGTATHLCVASTILDVPQRGYRLILLRDCTASYAEDYEKAACSIVSSAFGTVMDSDDFFGFWLNRPKIERE